MGREGRANANGARDLDNEVVGLSAGHPSPPRRSGFGVLVRPRARSLSKRTHPPVLRRSWVLETVVPPNVECVKSFRKLGCPTLVGQELSAVRATAWQPFMVARVVTYITDVMVLAKGLQGYVCITTPGLELNVGASSGLKNGLWLRWSDRSSPWCRWALGRVEVMASRASRWGTRFTPWRANRYGVFASTWFAMKRARRGPPGTNFRDVVVEERRRTEPFRQWLERSGPPGIGW